VSSIIRCEVVIGPLIVVPKVCPSPAAASICWMPMTPPAPGRFSITMGWPRRSASGSVMIRASTSGEEPAGKPT
jgi:hypothetical protein